jgi:hypothetical protein
MKTFAGELFPHQPLGNTAPIHGHDVEHHASSATQKCQFASLIDQSLVL